ncbi:hypothetical protein PanWU01x14_154080, partial [Parasponia andersonii]
SDIFESDHEALEVDDEDSLTAREVGEEAGLEGLRFLLDNPNSKENEKGEAVQEREDDKVDQNQIAGVEIKNSGSKEMIRI